MKELKLVYEYTCDVCGKKIENKEELCVISIPISSNGDSFEWHFHVGSSNESCNKKVIHVIKKFYSGMLIDA